MKKLLFLLFFMPYFGFSQVYKTNVIEVPETNKEILYDRAKVWVARIFRSANDVIQLDDKGNGRLIAKGNINYPAPAFVPGTNYDGRFDFMLTIEVKDGKYKYTIEDVYHESSKSGYSAGNMMLEKPNRSRWSGAPSPKGYRKMKDFLNERIESTVYSLSQAMAKDDTKDSW